MKTREQRGILHWQDAEASETHTEIVSVSGCEVSRWESYADTVSGYYSQAVDNSYLYLEAYGSRVQVFSDGELFGRLGEIARGYTERVREVLNTSRAYRLDILDTNEIGSKTLRLRLRYV